MVNRMHFKVVLFKVLHILIIWFLPCRLEENEKLVLTPFEKNLDIWRQLWRVVERSDLVGYCIFYDFIVYQCTHLCWMQLEGP